MHMRACTATADVRSVAVTGRPHQYRALPLVLLLRLRHGALRPLRHPCLLPSHLRPWRNQCQGRAEGPAGQLWLARIVVVLVPDAPARRGTRVNEKLGDLITINTMAGGLGIS